MIHGKKYINSLLTIEKHVSFPRALSHIVHRVDHRQLEFIFLIIKIIYSLSNMIFIMTKIYLGCLWCRREKYFLTDSNRKIK